MLELEEEIDWDQHEGHVRPICLASSGDFTGDFALVSGWGQTFENGGKISNVLRYVDDRRVMSQRECQHFSDNLSEGVVCIDTSGGMGTCIVSFIFFWNFLFQ